MLSRLTAAGAVLALASVGGAPAHAAPNCEVDHPIVFAALDWDSNSFHTAVAQFVVKNGYGCEVDQIPGSTIPLHNGMARGDIHVMMEVWKSNVPQSWIDALAAGKVKENGVNFPDAVQAWYVPRYLVEGANAPAKGLKSVSDLPKYKAVFKDPEEPSKGRFYNCIAGWQCEVTNTKKMHAYGLLDDYVNFRPGTGAALAAAIESNIKRKQPIVFYYWGPTWLMGKVGKDVVKLEEPAYDEAIWNKMNETKEPSDVKQATAYPVVEVVVGINTEFSKKAPKITTFLEKYDTTGDMVSGALAFMQETGGSAEDAAKDWLRKNESLWTTWVGQDVAERVKAALSTS